MKKIILIVAVAFMAISCSKEDSHPGIQINDSEMYISASPIVDKPVTFWHSLSGPRVEVLREALSLRNGPPGISIAPEGKDPIDLWKVEVTDARLSRKVEIKQGDNVLYRREQDITQTNLNSLTSCTISSHDWNEITLSNEDILFSVDYWWYYESPHGSGGYSVVSDLVMIPVRKE
ncbi:hypothetical protein [Coraliomargarita parva]|uniref:hypothetical protein n=1 Tax=Coraliomargarita parva TaxID=3014050 RepID=UPI0022B341DD|nr:hypothetical protein [Coraliomargarita parva]